MSDERPTDPDRDADDALLGGTEDAAVDERAEALRDEGIMPDVASIRADERERPGA
ncbi:hypothetical protein GCM10009846_08880 [Agrococcus versicolor]|uniref:Uncharacterized protein n=1 Tax=Agrococcus versicolor TaxID=501482 RepID=A0ABN3AM03_9MICO